MISLLSAPTNLGLRPPQPGSVPGTAKAPEALREAGLFRRFTERGAVDAGVVLPGRYVDDDATRGSDRVRNETALIEHARCLATRITSTLATGGTPLVIGGDCSLLVGVGLAVAGRGMGLVHVDGHTDFRHPANSDACASVAGEDLAVAIGRHRPSIADVDGRGPYFPADRTVHIGCRDDDEHTDEARTALGLVVPASDLLRDGHADVGRAVRAVVGERGHWLHVDVDVLDPVWMPAVDSPDPGGIGPDDLVALLREVAPGALGACVTVFDPDLDPDGRHARLVADVVADGLADLGTAAPR